MTGIPDHATRHDNGFLLEILSSLSPNRFVYLFILLVIYLFIYLFAQIFIQLFGRTGHKLMWFIATPCDCGYLYKDEPS